MLTPKILLLANEFKLMNLKARVARAAPHGPLPPTRATLPGAIFLEAARPSSTTW
jgi:hypothetical protein